MVSLPSHTFTGQALFSKWLTSIVHIILPEGSVCVCVLVGVGGVCWKGYGAHRVHFVSHCDLFMKYGTL